MKYLKDQEFMDKFGRKLKKVREANGMIQEKLANLVDLPQSQIARTELGHINTSISHVSIYAKIFKMDAKELFDFSDL